MAAFSFLSCFFPAYNEEGNVGRLIEDALNTLPQFADRFEILIVDDGSTDATAAVVARYAATNSEVRLVQHDRNLGYGLALRTGFAACKGDTVFFSDADMQFHLSDIKHLLEPFESADIVVGYRIKRRDPWHRLVVARVYHGALRALFGLRVRDVDCAFKLFDRKVVDGVVGDLQSRSAFVSPELVIRARRAGFRLVELGVEHYPRTAGRPKGASLKVIVRTLGEMSRFRSVLKADDHQSVGA